MSIAWFLFTLGTGVGGGIIIGDTMCRRAQHGAEIGHMKISFPTAPVRFADAGAARSVRQRHGVVKPWP